MRAGKSNLRVTTILAGLALSFGAPVGAKTLVPRLDVATTCRPISKSDGMQLDEKRCRESEKAAREQLAREWTKFPAKDRAECTTLATMGGTASYVELITCLEMKRHVSASQTDASSTPSARRIR